MERRGDLLIAVALTEFSVHTEDVAPDLSERAWLLAANRLIEYDIEPEEIVNELEMDRSHSELEVSPREKLKTPG
nr:hypothetical protein [Natronorubrum halophilum]